MTDNNSEKVNFISNYFTPTSKRRRSSSSPNIAYKKNSKEENPHPSEDLEATSNPMSTMDQMLDSIGQLLEAKLDEKLKNLSTKIDVQQLDNKITTFYNKCMELESKFEELQKENYTLKVKIRNLERDRKANNIIIYGLDLPDNLISGVKKFFKTALGIEEEIVVSKVQKINKRGADAIMLVQLIINYQIGLIFRNAHKLKNTGIYISKDLIEEDRNQRKILLSIKKEISRQNNDEPVKLRDNCLLIKNKRIFWTEGIGLTVNGQDCVQEINNELKINITGFIQNIIEEKSDVTLSKVNNKIAFAQHKEQEKLEDIVTERIEGVEGKSVELPCNITPPGHDKVYMVFWFKEDAGIPLYSLDVRGKPLSQGRHWSAPEVFGPRAYFRSGSEPASLLVKEIRRHDEGVYRCRIDFRNTPTRSFRYNLTVTVPPEYPALFDKWGRQLNGSVGPLDEGDELQLTCRVVGGKPEPRVRWLVNEKVVDEEYEHNSGDVIENRLSWRAVTRADLNSIFSCEASNTNLSEPRESSVVLQLYLRPLVVKITSKPRRLVAGNKYELSCESAGSRPPAVITWYKGKRLLRRVKGWMQEETGEEANITTSRLTFVPSTEDDGKPITCRAENPNVTGLYLDTNWNLRVVYPPIVSLRLGSTLNASDIKEGDDVYFECSIRSNPTWRKLTWYHNGEMLSHNMSARLILINQSLVLQKVTRQSSGLYSCVAANTEGETNSSVFHLRVKYSPSCRHDRVMVVGASRAESLDIPCQVDADPPATSFRWKFNNSGETLEVGSERFSSNGTTSVLRYTPIADLDYGTLSCWAENTIAPQSVPCLFQVVAAGKPFPVRNCTMSNETSNSLVIGCQAGSDGGLPQVFLLEVYTDQVKRFNFTAPDSPYFLIADLEAEKAYSFVVYAMNSKGKSLPTNVGTIVLKDPEKREGEESEMGIPPVVGIASGVGITILILTLLLLCKVKYGNDTQCPIQEKPSTIYVAQAKQQTNDCEEKDPDVIPIKYDPAHTESGQGEAFQPEQVTWRVSDTVQNGKGLWKEDYIIEPELNGNAIKERLMTSQLPESCV